MARTKNPNAATTKAWDTRARKGEGSGTANKSTGDFAALEKMRATMGTGEDSKNPVFILGATVHAAAVNGYLKNAGATEMTPAPLPEGVERGERGNCYANATGLMIRNEDLDFCEGIAYPSGAAGGMAFMHAWAVDQKTGKVVDPTWDKPEECRYYGVRYDRKKYLKHIVKAKMYGVLGGDFRDAAKVVERGGL